jgi:hypothetical protein
MTNTDSLNRLLERVCIRHFGKADTRSGEIVKRVELLGDTEGFVVYERKYGREQGRRTVLLAVPDNSCPSCNGTKLHVEQDTFRPTPAQRGIDATTAPRPKMPAAPALRGSATTTVTLPIAVPPEVPHLEHRTGAWHVIKASSDRIIARCDSLADAQEVAAALGNDKVRILRRLKHAYFIGPWPTTSDKEAS